MEHAGCTNTGTGFLDEGWQQQHHWWRKSMLLRAWASPNAPKSLCWPRRSSPLEGHCWALLQHCHPQGPRWAWHVPLAMACVPCQLLGDTGQGAAPWDGELPQGHSTLLPRAHALSHLESYSLKTPSKFSLENRGEGRNNGYSRTKGEKDWSYNC